MVSDLLMLFERKGFSRFSKIRTPYLSLLTRLAITFGVPGKINASFLTKLSSVSESRFCPIPFGLQGVREINFKVQEEFEHG